MELWLLWWSLVSQLRPACPRRRTFFWLALVLAALCTRQDLAGVTSFVRVLGLEPRCYQCLLDFFHSPAICVDQLAQLWTRIVLRIHPGIERCQGRVVILADGLKKAKSGRKMPGVKLLHQESDSNTKPSFIMGHSCQALAVLARAGSAFHAIPLIARIHEGLVFSNADQRTLLDKLLRLLQLLKLPEPVLLVADAYYACSKIIRGMLAQGGHLISRMKRNACAYELPIAKKGQRRRGRPRKFGRKVPLISLFDGPCQKMPSPAYGEHSITVRFVVRDLLWRPAGCLVRFVAVIHPSRGRILLLCTDLTLPPSEIVRLYSLRFKIEVTFKQSLHTVGSWAYHFWMRAMDPIKRHGGNQFLHHQSERYRGAVRRKLAAYHRYIQFGLIAQGLLQSLAALQPALVWRCFASWIRTKRSLSCPSEMVVATALRNHLGDFLAASPFNPCFKKFFHPRIDTRRPEGIRLVA